MQKQIKEILRKKRHKRNRKKIFGVKELPRLNVYRSLNHIYAQLVDDAEGKILVSQSTLTKEIKSEIKTGGNINSAKIVGAKIAEKALNMGIKKIVFDKGGYLYHGRVKALADAAREKGLIF
ncbi:MAG: 50S ribosomal protein L18 [Candidatus Firestonebacteria bacterium]|nr:50S ribosomal protein L18 [Candidatus Firestonebacteria bacterium]